MRRPDRPILLVLSAGIVLAVLGGTEWPFSRGADPGFTNRAFSPYAGNTLLGAAAALVASAVVLWGLGRRGVRRPRPSVPTVRESAVAAGIALVVTGTIIGPPGSTIEAAYFLRSVGAPAYAGVTNVTFDFPAAFSPHDWNTFLGAGAALVLLVVASIAEERLGARRRPTG